MVYLKQPTKTVEYLCLLPSLVGSDMEQQRNWLIKVLDFVYLIKEGISLIV